MFGCFHEALTLKFHAGNDAAIFVDPFCWSETKHSRKLSWSVLECPATYWYSCSKDRIRKKWATLSTINTAMATTTTTRRTRRRRRKKKKEEEEGRCSVPLSKHVNRLVPRLLSHDNFNCLSAPEQTKLLDWFFCGKAWHFQAANGTKHVWLHEDLTSWVNWWKPFVSQLSLHDLIGKRWSRISVATMRHDQNPLVWLHLWKWLPSCFLQGVRAVNTPIPLKRYCTERQSFQFGIANVLNRFEFCFQPVKFQKVAKTLMTLSGILPGRVFDTSRDSHQGGTSKGVRRDCSLHDSFITHLKKAGYHHFTPLSRNTTLSIIFSKAEKKTQRQNNMAGEFWHTHCHFNVHGGKPKNCILVSNSLVSAGLGESKMATKSWGKKSLTLSSILRLDCQRSVARSNHLPPHVNGMVPHRKKNRKQPSFSNAFSEVFGHQSLWNSTDVWLSKSICCTCGVLSMQIAMFSTCQSIGTRISSGLSESQSKPWHKSVESYQVIEILFNDDHLTVIHLKFVCPSVFAKNQQGTLF